jgi:hypothetical protein
VPSAHSAGGALWKCDDSPIPRRRPIPAQAPPQKAPSRAGRTVPIPRPEPSCPGRQPYPPIGSLGLAPQKTIVPTMPMMWTATMLKAIDFAVAVPTPTGPPEAL